MTMGEVVEVTKKGSKTRPMCGLVMPISEIGDCSESHWTEVLKIVTEAVDIAGFDARLVSSADEVTIIQKTIVQNLYTCPIVVVDVSQKNPNVMFELGMRLAFDKPTVIIKDDKTNFSFDTGIVEHIPYRRDLRYQDTLNFKEKLSQKVLATFEKQQADKDFSIFLKHFGQFKVASLDEKEVSGQEFIIDQLSTINKELARLRAPFSPRRRPISYPAGNEIDICCGGLSNSSIQRLKDELIHDDHVNSVRIVDIDGHTHLMAASNIASIEERRIAEDRYNDLVKELRQNPPPRRRLRAVSDESVERGDSD